MAKKVFDSGVDHSVVSLSENEKNELKEKLEAARSEMSGKAVNGGGQSLKSTVPAAKSPSIFKVLWNFLRSILMNTPFKKDATISTSRLREVKKHLGNIGIPFINFKSNSVSSEFANYIYEIYRAISKIQQIFINPQMEKSNSHFSKSFFESLMSDNALQVLESLSEEKLNSIFYDDKVKDKRAYLKSHQKDLMETLRTSESKKLISAILPMDQLLNIPQYFDFEAFFSLFGSFNNKQFLASYSEIESDKVVPYLKQLGAAAKVVTEQDLSEDTQKALEYANRSTKEFKKSEQKLDILSAENIKNALGMTRKLIKLEIVDSMLQYITMDDASLSGFVKPKKFILNHYMSQMLTNTTQTFNLLENEKAKEFLMRNILDFFQVKTQKELIYPGFYTLESKQHFESQDIKGMAHVKPLSVMMTFLKKYYEGQLRDIINVIVVKGDFIRKAEGEEFSMLYYNLDDLIEKMNTFIKTELTPSDDSPNILVELLHVPRELTPVEKKTVREKMKKNDVEIGEMLEKMLEKLFYIFEYLQLLSGDLRKRHPEKVSNIKTLPHISSNLEKAKDIMEMFFSIIRNFMVIKSEINSSLKKMDALGK